jgi:hypothetical protein
MQQFSPSALAAFRSLGHSESEIQRALLEAQSQPSDQALSLAELRELGIDTDGELVISTKSNKRGKR